MRVLRKVILADSVLQMTVGPLHIRFLALDKVL